jgi:hypothetical protein
LGSAAKEVAAGSIQGVRTVAAVVVVAVAVLEAVFVEVDAAVLVELVVVGKKE